MGNCLSHFATVPGEGPILDIVSIRIVRGVAVGFMSFVTQFITNIGVFIASLMALAALNTVHSAVAGRTREFSTLRDCRSRRG